MSARRDAEEEAQWQRVREAVLRRDGNRCREGGPGACTGALHVHHLIPRHDGGRDELSNCITLCEAHHAARHPNLQVSLSRRALERWGLRVARWLDRNGELPADVKAFRAGLELFGVPRFRDGQLEAVLAALRGEDVLVVRPTGSGKTLCFQLPAVLSGQPATIVLSPLKALMADQVGALQRRMIPSTFINSDVGGAEREARYQLVEEGGITLLYVAPERFDPERVRPDEIARLARLRPQFLVVDEAHVVDQWGEDFRPAYGAIGALRERLGRPPMLAFTATAGARTQERIKESLGVPGARVFTAGVDRPNITLARAVRLEERERAEAIARLVRALPEGRALIFVPTTKTGEKVKQLLAAAGLDLPLYHGRLKATTRENLQGQFLGTIEPPVRALISTSAFSMGIDIPDIRLVVHWQHPGSVEEYLQEFGRAGRDGEPALAVLFAEGGREAGLLEWMADRTAESALESGRTTTQVAAARRVRQEAIGEINRLARDSSRCFRAALYEALGVVSEERRQSIALRIINRLFVRRQRVKSARICCDVCHPDRLDELGLTGLVSTQPRSFSGLPGKGRGDSRSGSAGPKHAAAAPRATNDVEAAILSLVEQRNRRLSPTMAVDILRGSSEPTLLERGHHELPEYGRFRSRSSAELRRSVYELLNRGDLVRSGHGMRLP